MNRNLTMIALVACTFALWSSDSTATTCVAREWNHNLGPLASWDTMEHWSGKHRVAATFKFQCTCAEDCRSSCLPSWGSTQCTESGLLRVGIWHKRTVKDRLKPNSKGNATSTGVDCGAGYGCFITTCVSNACANAAISTELAPLGVGIGIEFTTNSEHVLWEGQIDHPFQCDACMTVEEASGSVGEPENNPDIRDDGNGGDSGGMPGGCSWRCVSNFYGQGGEGARVEDCSMIC